MNILIDINHPAHVHYFRNFIKEMSLLGHKFVITNRGDKLISNLLDSYGIEHIDRNRRPTKRSKLKSLWYLIMAILFVRKIVLNNRIDFFMGFGSPIVAINAFLNRKPVLLLADTEHNHLNHALYKPFVSALLTPYYFKKQIRKDQIYFKAFVENLYLKFREQRTSSVEFYVLCRFSAFEAAHDSKVRLEDIFEYRRKVVERLSESHKVVVCSENEILDNEFREHIASFKPSEVHDLISGASLFISEGATMACEAGILGVPYVYTNPLKVGYIDEQCAMMNYAHQMSYAVLLDILSTVPEKILNTKTNSKLNTSEFVDPTSFLIWFVINYPASKELTKGKLISASVFNQLKNG